MKKILTFLITLILIVSINPVFASTKTVSAGIGPNSFFYFIDIALEEVNLFFTFNAEKKAKIALEYADERIAEIAEIEKDKTPKVYTETVNRYQKQLSYAKEISAEIEQVEKKESLLSLITEKEKANTEIIPFVVTSDDIEMPEILDNVEEVESVDVKQVNEQKPEVKKETKLKMVRQVKKQVIAKAEPKDDENEKELEKLRIEVEKLKADQQKVKNEAKQELAREAQKLADQQDAQRRKKELEQQQQIENQKQDYDKILSKLITQRRENIEVFQNTLIEVEDFAPVIQITMNKYPNEIIIQQLGQDLLKENMNLASISKKLISIETDRVDKLSSYLGLGILPKIESFSQETQQYNDYYQRYLVSDTKMTTLINNFVSNEKTVLVRLSQEAKQKLENARNYSSAQESDPQMEFALSTLQTTLNNEENKPVSMTVIIGRKEKAVQSWIKGNPNIFSSSKYINRFNSILTSYGLYHMLIQ